MRLSLGFSPCPNDTFIFDAMIHHKIDTEGLEFDLVMEDVEALNQKAFAGALDITKLSYHAFAYVIDQYILLDAGSALGNNCGPLLIAKQPLVESKFPEYKIAIPGKLTTANFLLGLAYPNLKNKKEFLFSEIEDAVLSGQVDAGLIIHENRFTYQEKGLIKIRDLGSYWEETTGFPIPLGGIMVKRDLDIEIQQRVNRVLSRSIQFAFQNPDSTLNFVKEHAQEMSTEVMFQHIKLYVNDYTKSLGTVGKSAVNHLFSKAVDLELIPDFQTNLFLDT